MTGEVSINPWSLVVSIVISGLFSGAVAYLYWKVTAPHGKGRK